MAQLECGKSNYQSDPKVSNRIIKMRRLGRKLHFSSCSHIISYLLPHNLDLWPPSYVCVSPGTRVRAPVASVRSAPSVAVSRVVRLPDIRLLPRIFRATVEQRQHAGNEEEYDVHDAKRKAGLQHAALLVRGEVQAIEGR
jgi:hypothetical protein